MTVCRLSPGDISRLKILYVSLSVSLFLVSVSFWNNHRFLVRLNDPDLTGDDAYLIISRYLAYIGKHPSLASYQRLLDDKGYGKISFFRHLDYKTVFLNAKYDVEGKIEKREKR
jgi:hypothetical protein